MQLTELHVIGKDDPRFAAIDAKEKNEGRNLLIYTMQAISGGRGAGKKTLQRGIIIPSGLPISVSTKQKPTTIHQVHIVSKKGYYVVEVIYEQEIEQASPNAAYRAGVW